MEGYNAYIFDTTLCFQTTSRWEIYKEIWKINFYRLLAVRAAADYNQDQSLEQLVTLHFPASVPLPSSLICCPNCLFTAAIPLAVQLLLDGWHLLPIRGVENVQKWRPL